MEDKMQWQPIDANTEANERCLLWCTDQGKGGKPEGVAGGRIYRYSNGDVSARGKGYYGDWHYSHWMPFPDGPEVCPTTSPSSPATGATLGSPPEWMPPTRQGTTRPMPRLMWGWLD